MNLHVHRSWYLGSICSATWIVSDSVVVVYKWEILFKRRSEKYWRLHVIMSQWLNLTHRFGHLILWLALASPTGWPYIWYEFCLMLLISYQSITLQRIEQVSFNCDGCGGLRYVPCPACNGSKKSQQTNPFATNLRCMKCNKEGLARCSECLEQQE